MMAVPATALTPVIGAATPSLTLVAIVKLLLKLAAGVNVRPASSVLTSAMAPLAVQTPMPALYVEVTAPEVAVFKLPEQLKLIDALPRNPVGKVLKRELRTQSQPPSTTTTGDTT